MTLDYLTYILNRLDLLVSINQSLPVYLCRPGCLCFDRARSVDTHLATTHQTHERVVASQTRELLEQMISSRGKLFTSGSDIDLRFGCLR